MLRKMSFKSKLLSLCTALCLISVAVGLASSFSIARVSDHYRQVTKKNLPEINLVYQMFLEFREARVNLRTLDSRTLTPEQATASIKSIEESTSKYDELSKMYLLRCSSNEQKEKFEKVDAVWNKYKEAANQAIEIYDSRKPEDQAKIRNFFGVVAPQRAKAYQAAITELLSLQQAAVDQNAATAEASATQSNWLSLSFIVVGCSLGLLMGIWFSSRLTKDFLQLSHKLSEGADSVDKVAASVASASDQLSSSAAQQASALQETTAALEETSAMISKNADNAKKSAEVSGTCQQTVTNGKQAITDMMASITEISDSNSQVMQQVEAGNREIEAIVKVIAEIGNKTKVINDIVFQTKLLSFNASVEAARAGEHGKGFAVVAEEVGNLAQMSGSAAKEITEMLDESLKKVEQIVSGTKARVDILTTESHEKIAAGLSTAQKCEAVLEEIVSGVNQMSGMAIEIASASQEQAKGVAEINKAMNLLDKVSQQNSSASQQVSASSQELKADAGHLRMIVSDLNTTLQGLGTEQIPAQVQKGNETAKAVQTRPAPNLKPKPVLIDISKVRNPAASTAVPKKQVAGGSDTVPSAQDPRFEDI